MKKTIPRFPAYEIDVNGVVWKEGREIKPSVSKTGYLYVNFYLGHGKSKQGRVHRMVLETFIGDCPDGMQACHNNGIRTDNRLKNLRWDTPQGNQADRRIHNTDSQGEKHWHAKLNEKQVRVIMYCLRGGMAIKAIAKYFPCIKRKTIYNIKYGNHWKHVTINNQ